MVRLQAHPGLRGSKKPLGRTAGVEVAVAAVAAVAQFAKVEPAGGRRSGHARSPVLGAPLLEASMTLVLADLAARRSKARLACGSGTARRAGRFPGVRVRLRPLQPAVKLAWLAAVAWASESG